MVSSQHKAGLDYQQIEKIFESLPAYPNDAAGNPTPIPNWLVDEIAYSRAVYPEDWVTFSGTRNTDEQFKRMTGKNINDPNTYEINYAANTVTGIRPAGGSNTGYQNFTTDMKQQSFTLKVSDQWVQTMSNEGWTFNGGVITPTITQTQQFEFFPTAAAEPEMITPTISLSSQVNTIINDIQRGVVSIPDWFKNNVEWVKSGQITEQSFVTAFDNLIQREITVADDTITNNMVTQQVNDFTIINGRAKGSITFTATSKFNPYFYGKNIINIVQFKTPNGANILTYVKQNTLNFTETERTEQIFYDEDMQGNTRATIESYVWEWMDKPTGAFSKKYSINISETDLPKPIAVEGFMGAGIAGAIAGLILIGFIADHKRGK